jgi:hypothetical protein
LDKILAPVGFQIEWGEGQILFHEIDARRHVKFGKEQPLADRIEVALEDNGSMSEDTLASLLEVSIEKVETELSIDTRFSFNELKGNWEQETI